MIVIDIPQIGNILIKPGQVVDFSTPFIETAAQEDVKIQLSSHLHVPSKKIFSFLKKFVGEEIKKGDVIAEHKSFTGYRKYKSEFDGIIKEINHEDGSITIQIKSDDEEVINCHFKGEIHEIKDEKVSLKVKNKKGYKLKETPDDHGGNVLYFDPQMAVTEEMVRDKIIVAKSLTGYDQVKLETLGALGIITLEALQEETELATTLIQEVNDFEQIIAQQLPYCIVNKKDSTIFFYE
ncbi:hypothetical protein HGB07_04360 [Candidatus Roizmanbacteria bacterium]|nr:hypothetical protein [Candidatus Roizmanbacteria bacterium]